MSLSFGLTRLHSGNVRIFHQDLRVETNSHSIHSKNQSQHQKSHLFLLHLLNYVTLTTNMFLLLFRCLLKNAKRSVPLQKKKTLTFSVQKNPQISSLAFIITTRSKFVSEYLPTTVLSYYLFKGVADSSRRR